MYKNWKTLRSSQN